MEDIRDARRVDSGVEKLRHQSVNAARTDIGKAMGTTEAVCVGTLLRSHWRTGLVSSG